MEFFKERNLTFRLRMFVLGPPRGGKTSLVQSLTSSDQHIARSSSHFNDAIEMHHLWFPFRDTHNESLLNRKLDPSERALTIDVYDVPGTVVGSKCVQPFISLTSLPVIVFDISDNKSCKSVLADVSYIHNKLPKIPLIIVGLHADRILNEDERLIKRERLTVAINDQVENMKRDLNEELKTLRNGQNPDNLSYVIVQNRVNYLEDRLKHLTETPYCVTTASTLTSVGIDDLKKLIFENILNRECFPHIRKPVKETTLAAFRQLLIAKNQKYVIGREDIDKLLSANCEAEGINTSDVEKEVQFLADVGVIQIVQHSRLSAPLQIEMICIDPPALLKAIFSIHIDNPNKSYHFETKRFWPKVDTASTPSPGLLVKALEEIALHGYIRESVFPLLWQDIDMEEMQVIQIIRALQNSCFLIQENDGYNSPSFDKLVIPAYPGLSPHQLYRLPLLDLMSAEGPILNWTPELIQGDIQLCWRFKFFSREPPGLFAAILSFCRINIPNEFCKLHWKGGLLLKLGQVFIKLNKAVEPDHYLDVTSRVTADEEGKLKATEVLWSRTSNILMLIHQFLRRENYSSFKIILVPCPLYFTTESDEYDNWPEVPLYLCLQENHQNSLLEVEISGFGFNVDTNLLLPYKAYFDEDMESWLYRLSGTNATLSEEEFNPVCLEFESNQQTHTNVIDTPNVQKYSISTTVNGSSSWNSLQSFGQVRQLSTKNSSLKWEISDDQTFTEKGELEECKRVARGIVAIVLAEAIAAHFVDTSFQPNDLCQKVAKASVNVAKAAQTGDAEGTAKAIIAALLAVQDSNNRQGETRTNSVMRSKLCRII